MLARTPRFTCAECAKTEYEPGFVWYHGDPAEGPAYWSDKGVLCSPACAQAHFRARVAAGETPTVPAEPPLPE
jgi:hypothetical protein